MENSILKNTVEKLINIHLELTNLRLQGKDSLKGLGAILSEKLSDSSNPSKNILKFENLETVLNFDSICLKINMDIDTKQNEFKSAAKEISDLFPTILKAAEISGCGFSFAFSYQDKTYKIKITRVKWDDLDLIELVLFNDVDSNSYVELASFDFANASFKTDYSSVTRVLEQTIDETKIVKSGDLKLIEPDALFNRAAEIVVSRQQASTSLLQKVLKIGVNRADELINQLVSASIIEGYNFITNNTTYREVLIKDINALKEKLLEIRKK